MQFQPLGQEDALEKGMAAHSSILAWRIPWIEEPGRLQSMGSESQTCLTLTNTEEENEFRDLKSLPQAQESPTNY